MARFAWNAFAMLQYKTVTYHVYGSQGRIINAKAIDFELEKRVVHSVSVD